jgi:hypothetical protein
MSPSPVANKNVVIVIINHKAELSEYEKISLKQCIKVLGAYSIWMVVPDGLQTDSIEPQLGPVKILRVRDSYLSNYRNFNRFKISPYLYEHFKSYDYLLYYELDAFVFGDFLEYWCSLGFDYIGAPWVKMEDSERPVFEGVGNGGFSLRKISSHRRVLKTFKRLDSNTEIRNSYAGFSLMGRISYIPQRLMRMLGLKGNTHWRFNDYKENEDIFWSVRVPRVLSWFKVADPLSALRFSFELKPDELYRLNHSKLPFGCHSWQKDEQLTFWKEFIEREGYSLTYEDR